MKWYLYILAWLLTFNNEMGALMAEEKDWKSLPESYWREHLSPQEYHVLRESGTERAFSGKFVNHKANGEYTCAACGAALFASDTKFESGTGWPSFTDVIASSRITTHEDRKFFMKRTELRCARCGSHLGHVFDDGPAPTGLRYCINSVALDFVPTTKASDDKKSSRKK